MEPSQCSQWEGTTEGQEVLPASAHRGQSVGGDQENEVSDQLETASHGKARARGYEKWGLGQGPGVAAQAVPDEDSEMDPFLSC